MADTLRVAHLLHDSIVDGPGLRYVVFTQGCPHNCYGCHNPETHDFFGGYEISVEDILTDLMGNPLLQGITISGGEPFVQWKPLVNLAYDARLMGLTVWLWTGYIFEDLKSDWMPLVEQLDVIVDGPYMEDKRTLSLPWIGSSNQRVIDVQKTLCSQKVVLRVGV